jgi:hypothetical protein
MLSTNKSTITDTVILSICHETSINEVSRLNNLTTIELSLLLMVHALQKVYNRYLLQSDLLPLVTYRYFRLNKLIKVLRNKGYIDKIGHSINVSLNGIDLIRAYETRISRKYIEFTEKHRKEWRYIPKTVKKQKSNKQYPIIVDKRNCVKVLPNKKTS